MCLIYKNNKAPEIDQENITLYKVYQYQKDLNRLSSPYFIRQKGSIVTQPGLQISSFLSDQLLSDKNGFHAFKNVESAQSYLYHIQSLPLPLPPLMQLSLDKNNTQYVVLTVTALKIDVVAEGTTNNVVIVSQLTIDENEFYKFVHRPIVKKYGKDFHSIDGAPSTVNENDIGTDKHGWTFYAQLNILCEKHTSINEFQASHSIFGKVWGNFQSEVYAYSEAAYQNFCQYHTPNEFILITP